MRIADFWNDVNDVLTEFLGNLWELFFCEIRAQIARNSNLRKVWAGLVGVIWHKNKVKRFGSYWNTLTQKMFN